MCMTEFTTEDVLRFAHFCMVECMEFYSFSDGYNKLKFSFISLLVIPVFAIVGQLHVPLYRYVH